VRRLGDLTLHDLLEGVEALATGVEVVHQMHDCWFELLAGMV
jgi:hypothetical protein